jgi:hypothetical protein
MDSSYYYLICWACIRKTNKFLKKKDKEKHGIVDKV